MSFGKRAARIAVIVVALCAVAMGALYAYISSGGLIARKKPSSAETKVARWMVRASVPQASKMLKNPLNADPAGEDLSAGVGYRYWRNQHRQVTLQSIGRDSISGDSARYGDNTSEWILPKK